MEISRHVERDIVLDEEHIFGAAILSPAHSCDLSTWRLTIDRDGVLAQTIRVRQPPYRGLQVVTLHQHIAESDLQRLYDIASEIWFRHLKSFYSPADIGVACCGNATTALTARLHGEVTSVRFEGAGYMAYEGFDAAIRYCKLWKAIVSHAPFIPYVDKR